MGLLVACIQEVLREYDGEEIDEKVLAKAACLKAKDFRQLMKAVKDRMINNIIYESKYNNRRKKCEDIDASTCSSSKQTSVSGRTGKNVRNRQNPVTVNELAVRFGDGNIKELASSAASLFQYCVETANDVHVSKQAAAVSEIERNRSGKW